MTHFVTFPSNPEPLGRLIGYARVSTTDQKLDIQLDAFEKVGCTKVYKDHGISGAQAARPGLDALFCDLQAGDTLVVYKLDRLGRSSFELARLSRRLTEMDVQFCSLTEGINTHGFGARFVYNIFAAVAEFQRDMIRENTIAGLQAARDRGSKIGRPRKMGAADVRDAHRAVRQDGRPIGEVAKSYGVSISTLHRKFRALEREAKETPEA